MDKDILAALEERDEALQKVEALKEALLACLSKDLSFDDFVKKFGFSQEYCEENARLALAAFENKKAPPGEG